LHKDLLLAISHLITDNNVTHPDRKRVRTQQEPSKIAPEQSHGR
jgi:hypothetical protein